MAKKSKYYVVWKEHEPGVYTSWADCQAQIAGFSGAQYKSFTRRADAVVAFEKDSCEVKGSETKTFRLTRDELKAKGVILDSVCVAAACKGNPGDVEYRGVLFCSSPLAPFPAWITPPSNHQCLDIPIRVNHEDSGGVTVRL